MRLCHVMSKAESINVVAMFRTVGIQSIETSKGWQFESILQWKVLQNESLIKVNRKPISWCLYNSITTSRKIIHETLGSGKIAHLISTRAWVLITITYVKIWARWHAFVISMLTKQRLVDLWIPLESQPSQMGEPHLKQSGWLLRKDI